MAAGQEETIRRSQNSFSGGEIGAKVLGRVDLNKFNTGIRYGKNVFVEIEGAISNRAGFEYGGPTKFILSTVRFIPFEAPGDISYVVEAMAGTFRFYYRNALVLDDSFVIEEVGNPYAANEIYELAISQTNDIMTITHPNHPVKELRRTAFNAFSLVDIIVNPAIAAPTISIVANTGAAAGELKQEYVVSSVDISGVESLPSASVSNENNLDVVGNHNTIGWNEVAGADGYVVYKKRAGAYGFMGFVRQENYETLGPPRTYRAIDNQINPNTNQTPKRAENPFPTSNDYPAISFIFQQRRCFAASYSKPNSVIASQTGTFDGFRRSIPAVPDDYIEFALGAARTQQIKYVVSLDDLIIFTSSNEWRLSASNGFSATQPPDLKPQSSIGISDIPPLVVSTDIFFTSASKHTVYRMNYSFDFNKFMSDDISILAKHLFKNRALRGWCYAAEPHFIIFGFFDDGAGVMFAYNREQQIFGWTRVETDGLIDACCSIREDGNDRIYVAVRRRKPDGSFRRNFERLALRDFNNSAEAFFVDAGVQFAAYTPITSISGGVISTSPSNHGLADGDPIRLYDIKGSFSDDPDRDINTRYRADVVNATTFTLLDYVDSSPVDIDTFVYDGGGKIRDMVADIQNLDHLEGKQVVALADGFVLEGLTVAGGKVDLPFEAGLRSAGLSYTSEMHTLELEREEMPTRGRKKSVAHLVARIEETRGISVGLRESDIRELKERDYEPLPDAVNPGAEIFRETVGDGWEDEVRLIIRQTKPLPMTILSVIPEYTFGD